MRLRACPRRRAMPAARATARSGSRSTVEPIRCTGMTRARARPDRRRDRLGGEQVRLGVDVDELRRRAGEADGLGGGDERVRRDDDLVAGADAERPQRQRERLGAGGHADGVLGARSRRRTRPRRPRARCPCVKAPLLATRPTTASSSSSSAGSAWSSRVIGMRGGAAGVAGAHAALQHGRRAVALGEHGAQGAAAAVVEAVDRRLGLAHARRDLAGAQADEVAQHDHLALVAGQRRERLGQRCQRVVVGASTRGSSSRTSSHGMARRWRMWSTATLRATRRIHAANGTSRCSYLRQGGQQLREHVLRDVLGLVVVADDAPRRSRTRCPRTAGRGSGGPPGRLPWRARRPARRRGPSSGPSSRRVCVRKGLQPPAPSSARRPRTRWARPESHMASCAGLAFRSRPSVIGIGHAARRSATRLEVGARGRPGCVTCA